MEKICSRCNENKSIENFCKRKNSKDGYHGVCKKCRNSDKKIYRDNKVYTDEEISIRRESGRKNYITNKEIILIRCKKYRDNNKEAAKEYKKMYYYKNREKLVKYSTDFNLNRMKNDTLYKFSSNIRNLIKNSIRSKGYRKNTKTEQILGIDIPSFFKYIESKFEPWMNWDNYGDFDGNIGKELNHSWSIDHKIPIHTAKDEDEIIRLNHYTNLQPLCCKINMYIKNGRTNYYDSI